MNEALNATNVAVVSVDSEMFHLWATRILIQADVSAHFKNSASLTIVLIELMKINDSRSLTKCDELKLCTLIFVRIMLSTVNCERLCSKNCWFINFLHMSEIVILRTGHFLHKHLILRMVAAGTYPYKTIFNKLSAGFAYVQKCPHDPPMNSFYNLFSISSRLWALHYFEM